MRVALAVGFVVVLVSILAIVWTQQRRLIYFPFGEVASPEALGLDRVSAVTFPTSDGLTLNGWFVRPPKTPDFTIIVFNGNAGNRSYRAPLAAAFARANIAVLLFDYRGFGGNPGAPTESGLRFDARAAREFVLAQPDVDRERLVYFGESLGSAVATALAVDHPPAALVLRSPFTSLSDIGRVHYPMLPVRWLLRDRYDTLGRISRVRAPILIVGGDRDRIVPIAQTRLLYGAARDPKSLVIVDGADHNDDMLVHGRAMIEGVIRFLRSLPLT